MSRIQITMNKAMGVDQSTGEIRPGSIADIEIEEVGLEEAMYMCSVLVRALCKEHGIPELLVMAAVAAGLDDEMNGIKTLKDE